MEFLQNKFLLLDTCILLSILESQEKMAPFLKILNDTQCVPLIIDAVFFEFIRNARNQEEYDKLSAIIKDFDKISTRPDDINKAIELSLACTASDSSKSTQKISFIDYLLGAQLAKYAGRIFLATTNIKDFPLTCFKRHAVQAYDLTSRVISVGFISFNPDSFDKCFEIFKKGQVRGNFVDKIVNSTQTN